MQLQHPIIVVIGQPGAGKSTLLATLTGTTPAPFPPTMPTVFSQTCVYTHAGKRFYLIEGLDAYMPIEQMGQWVAAGMVGFLLMVEASQPYEFAPSRRELRRIWPHLHVPWSLDTLRSIPLVIAANKQDHRDAWDPEDMGIAFQLRHADIPLMGCTATDYASCKRVITALINQGGWRVKT